MRGKITREKLKMLRIEKVLKKNKLVGKLRGRMLIKSAITVIDFKYKTEP